MKKIITLILLLIFCIESTCWATEIIVGADGQARYADELESMVKEEVIDKNMNGGFNESQPAIKTKAEPEEIVSPYKKEKKELKVGQADKMPEFSIASDEQAADLKKIVQSYEKKNLKIINKAEKEINYQSVLSKIDINVLKSEKSYIKRVELCDGDYALWKRSEKNTQYAGEFHKDGSCMGVVKIHKLDRKTVVFYEYRSESLEAQTAHLKHIMIAYNDKHKACFIYSDGGFLRCCQYDNTIYSISLPVIPKRQEVVQSALHSKIEDAALYVLAGTGIASLVTITAIGMPVVAVGGIAAAVAFGPLFCIYFAYGRMTGQF